jgi:uncharacterized LabA/DUF88 family protein
LRPGQTLEQITYFTARVRNDPEAQRRQSDYLDALASHSSRVSVVDGRFQEKLRRCRDCGAVWTVYEERETDVNIAAALIEDAVLDRYDTALLVSADSDLCPAIVTMKRLCPEKRIIAAFPPKRHSADLKRAVDGYLPLGDDKIRQAQLPTEVVNNAGITLRRPKHWI